MPHGETAQVSEQLRNKISRAKEMAQWLRHLLLLQRARFSSEHLHSVSQTPVIPVQRDLASLTSSDFSGKQTGAWHACMHTHMQAKSSYTK